MHRTPITADFSQFPAIFHSFLQDATIFDSSCSSAARVYFLDKGPGFYLKTDRYRQRFLDAYGRENIYEDIFRTIAAAEVFG